MDGELDRQDRRPPLLYVCRADWLHELNVADPPLDDDCIMHTPELSVQVQPAMFVYVCAYIYG